MSRKILVIFCVILFVASILRLYKIESVPPGVNQDEASIGYTAYSILSTGRDEYGRLFPFSFESFGDWKLPLYIYLVVPFVYFFGLSELAVRLPSALFGIASVALTFFFVRLLFENNRLALLSMFLVAVSPWSLHLSRVESESNTAVFLTLLGVTFFLKSLKEKQWFLILSLILFALTYFTYAGNHIFTTLLILGLVFIYRSKLKITKTVILSVMIFLAMTGVIFYATLFGADRTKLSGISIFGDPALVHAQIEIPRNEHPRSNSLFAKLTHNRLIFALERFGQNYLASYSPQFLFIKGGENKAHNIANFGNMYLIEAPFLFLGLVYLIAFKKGKERNLVLWWFFIAPIAAAITKDAPHTNRMFSIFPMLSLMVASGLYWAIRDFVVKKWMVISILAIAILFMANIALYIDRYYVHFPRDEAQNWGAGYKTLNDLISEREFARKKIVMARPTYSPYIFLLFYSKYPPSLYQKEARRYPPTSDKFIPVKSFDRYTFRTIDWGKDLDIKDALLVSWSSDFPESLTSGYKQKFEAFLPNGQSLFTVLETR